MKKMNWQKQLWKDVLSIVNGKNQKEVQSDNGMFPIIGSGGEIGRANDFLCEAGSTVVGRKGTINNPFFVGERFWNVDTAFGIQPGENLNPKFLFYFCKSYNFKKLDKSTTIPSLAKTDLLKIEMPVPSLDEQEKIVNRVEELFSELDSAVETLKKTKEQLAVYRQSVLNDAFDNLESSQSVPFESLLVNMRNGYGKKPDDSGTYKILRISSVRPMSVVLDDFRLNKSSFLSDDLVQENDLLFTRYNGSRELVGVCARVPHLYCDYAYPDKIIRCRLKDGNEVLAKYLQYYFNQGDALKCIRSMIKTTSGQNGIAGSDLKKVMVLMTDLKKQREIVSTIELKLSACDSIEKTVNDALAQAEAMRQSILKKAFEGEL